jgi:hypothetical protein
LRVFGPIAKSSLSSEKPKSRQKPFDGEAKMSRVFVVQQKLTQNLQIRLLIYLTENGEISISCGQGSAHPHPVVVDNVLGSFGNF